MCDLNLASARIISDWPIMRQLHHSVVTGISYAIQGIKYVIDCHAMPKTDFALCKHAKSMYTCRYVCMKICTLEGAHVCACMRVCTYAHVHVCMHAMYVCVRVHMRVHACVGVCMYVSIGSAYKASPPGECQCCVF